MKRTLALGKRLIIGAAFDNASFFPTRMQTLFWDINFKPLKNKTMMKSIYCILISLIMLSCGSTKNTTQQVPDEHNSQNALDWDGIYRGTLPCADCEGILTTITLQKDMNFSLKTRYLGKSDSVYQEHGKFKWNNAGSEITLNPSGSKEKFIYRVGENTLTRLDQNGNKITGELASHYILSKGAFNIYERYWKLVELNGKQVVADSTFRKEPHLIFKDDNRIVGNGGCNSLLGGFSLEGVNHIKMAQVASTMMACPGLELEDQLIKILKNADTFAVEGDELILNNADGAPLAKFKSVVMK